MQAGWVHACLHLPEFLPLPELIRRRSWFIVRADTGRLGPVPARILAAVVYGLFEAAFRRAATAARPIPYVVAVDELGEVGAGLELETALATGAKFGLWVWAVAHSLAGLKADDALKGVAEALLANTSAQAVFRPSAGDQELVEALLGLRLRYGAHTFDLPALTCWLRAALEGRTQPPVLVRVEGLPRVEPARVEEVIYRAVRLRPDIYRELAGVPEQVESLLSEFVGRLDEELLELIFGGGPGGRLARYFEEGS